MSCRNGRRGTHIGAGRHRTATLRSVTTADVIAHWRKGAKDALRLANHAANDEIYDLALSHGHRPVEKALKAAIMEKPANPHPKVHALARLATAYGEDWPQEDRELFDALSDFAVAARYDDPAWAERF